MPSVRVATEDDLADVGRSLAAAFADDPIWRWLCPGVATWMPRATRYYVADVRTRLRAGGTVLVPTDGGAAAIWAPPGRWRSATADAPTDLLPALELFRQRTARAMRLLSAIERRHPTEPHWYLALLGTRPDRRGHGVGSALVTTITERCDAEQVGAYLESSKRANVPFYERHGFEVTGTVSSGHSPPMWLMWRDPQPAG